MRRGRNILIVVWIVGALVAPVGAWLLGVRNSDIEQRTFAPRPSLEPGTLLDRKTIDGLDHFLTDRLPLRDRAAVGRALVYYRVFGTSTNPGVTIGSDGWLFLTEELGTCGSPYSVQTETDAFAATLTALRNAAPQAALVVAPDKAGMYRDRFAHVSDAARCAFRRNAETRASFEVVPGVVTAWDALETARQRAQTYYKVDTHWSPLGRAAIVQEVLTALGGAWDPAAVTDAPGEPSRGDLGRFLGLDLDETLPQPVIARPGVTATEVPAVLGQPPSIRVFESKGTGALLPATVVVGDSQFEHALGELVPWFERLTFCHWDAVNGGKCDQQLADTSAIVVESVQRSIAGRFQLGQFSALMAGALSGLQADHGTAVQVGDTGAAEVDVAVPAGASPALLIVTGPAPLAGGLTVTDGRVIAYPPTASGRLLFGLLDADGSTGRLRVAAAPGVEVHVALLGADGRERPVSRP